jgi:hypothetical protein
MFSIDAQGSRMLSRHRSLRSWPESVIVHAVFVEHAVVDVT